jgi:hypothetical protein
LNSGDILTIRYDPGNKDHVVLLNPLYILNKEETEDMLQQAAQAGKLYMAGKLSKAEFEAVSKRLFGSVSEDLPSVD